jgi:DNA-binding CsgD family transcriptional regulator
MAWKDLHTALSRAGTLSAEDLERLATAAYMLGDEAEYLAVLERAHRAHLDNGAVERAVRCGFWIGLQLTLRGDIGRATGWLGRAQRRLADRDCVERGYLQLLAALLQDDERKLDAAAELGQRFGDADLLSLAVQEQGNARILGGDIEAGLSLLDEAMVAVTAGELSPIATGLVYCSVIITCQNAYELRRAQEWTVALAGWCEQQQDLVAFTGRCLVHRAEIMQVHGEWDEALEEARRGAHGAGAAQAHYRQGELHRLRGEFDAAERAYREAALLGDEPQPGLALLRLAQGAPAAAAATIRRLLGETSQPLRRALLLPAQVEIALAAGEPGEAGAACDELERLAGDHPSAMLAATVAHARGAFALAAGEPAAALVALRRAETAWLQLDAPYETARVRVLVAECCRALGDEDSAALGLDAARATFERLGAGPDLERIEPSGGAHGLSPRELQVLRLVAAGDTNRAIAAELVLSERTVDRHVSNIFAKLGVSSRAAATAYAYEHRLVGEITQ